MEKINKFLEAIGKETGESGRVPAGLEPVEKYVPVEHRDLFVKVVFAREYKGWRLPPLSYAKRLPGGILLLHPMFKNKNMLTSELGVKTVLHEYGHQVWDFVFTEKERKLYREIFEKIKEEAKTHIDPSWFMIRRTLGLTPEESFSEAYAWYYMKDFNYRKRLYEQCPEIYNFFIKFGFK